MPNRPTENDRPTGNPFLGGAPIPAAGQALPEPGSPFPEPVEGQTSSGIWIAIGLSICFNLLTLGGVVFFGWPPGNVLVLFWIENVVIGAWSFGKVLTARGTAGSQQTDSSRGTTPLDPRSAIATRLRPSFTVNGTPRNASAVGIAFFFLLHYGIFCVVHGVFTAIVAFPIGVEPSFWWLGFPVILIMVRYGVETITTWFGRGGQRWAVSPSAAMTAPYPRIIVLHLSILIAFGFTIGDLAENDLLVEIQQFLQPALDLLPSAVQTDGVLVVLVLVVIKTVVDVVTTRRALRR